MPNHKRSRGRQKIEIKKIENLSNRYATYSKRCKGIVKKASELSLECKADVGLIIFSPTGRPSSFMSPSFDAVSYRFINGNQTPDDVSRLVEAYGRARMVQLGWKIEQLESKTSAETERALKLQEIEEKIERGNCWDRPVKELAPEDVERMKLWLADLLVQLKQRACIMKSEVFASSSLFSPSTFMGKHGNY